MVLVVMLVLVLVLVLVLEIWWLQPAAVSWKESGEQLAASED